MIQMMGEVGLFLFLLEFNFVLIYAKDVKAEDKFMVQNGSTVAIHYTLTVDHKVVDSSIGKKPLIYVQGLGQIIPGMEEQLKDLKQGDKKHITIPAEKGYGPINSEAFQNVPRKSFKNSKFLKVGAIVTGRYKGNPVQATIIGIDKKNVILDLNHPLAGKTLEFDVEVMEIKHEN
ncbi:MAG: peptidylprolyl isomerase [Elusimicrobia bacterium]|nr:peptidylprolyl isomerase [Elusimicrobiota bacterium]